MAMKQDRDATLEDVLNTALKRETAAFKFYETLLVKHGQDSFMRGLLDQLKTEERKHIRLIEKKLADLRMGRDIG